MRSGRPACPLHWRIAIQITTIAIQNCFCVAKVAMHFSPRFRSLGSETFMGSVYEPYRLRSKWQAQRNGRQPRKP